MPSADQIVQTGAGIPAVSGPALAVSRPALAVSGPAPGGAFGGSSVSGALWRNRAQTVHRAYSSHLTGSAMRTIGAQARERRSPKGSGYPADGARNDQS